MPDMVLKPETKKQLIASIRRYAAEELELDIGDLKAGSLLEYALKEIGPSIYNQAILDAQTFIQERALDLESIFSQKEFTYWSPKVGESESRRVKRPDSPTL